MAGRGALKIGSGADGPARPIALEWLGANRNAPAPHGDHPLPLRINTIHGAEPSRWCVGQTAYAAVTYPDLYPGLDLQFHAAEGAAEGVAEHAAGGAAKGSVLEFDFLLTPGSDPRSIRFRPAGVKSVGIDNRGSLVLQGNGPPVVLGKPYAFQGEHASRREIAASYTLSGSGVVGIRVGRYNRKLALTIDPVLAYSTYLGGGSYDAIYASAVDASGSVYVAGETYSTALRSGSGVRSNKDLFVTKLNSTGAAVFTTILGGSDSDTAQALAVDSAGNIYLTGNTLSVDFPVTPGAFKVTPGGLQDAFVLKLSANGVPLYGSYLGAQGSDFGTGIAVDSTGSAYVTGYTSSVNFPTTAGAQQTVFGGGVYDAFVARFDPSGAVLWYSTLLGGSGTDLAHGIAIDRAGSAYIAGQTDSLNFPQLNALQTANAGQSDAFVTKLDGNGRMLYSTYLGGLGADLATAVAVDTDLNAYVTGASSSVDFPVSSTAVQGSLKGLYDAFLAKINPAGTALVYATYIGGNSSDTATSVAVDTAGNTFICGFTTSSDFPVLRPTQSTSRGSADAFVTVVDPLGAQFRYSSYLGGTGDDRANAIAVLGNIAYVAGVTSSTDFPIAGGAAQTVYGGNSDGFLTKIQVDLPPAVQSVSPSNGTGSSQPFVFTYADPAGYQDISGSQIVINSTLSGVNSCYILFGRGSNGLSLADDAGTPGPLTTIGAPSLLQNSQCSVLASLSSQSGSGNTLTLTVYVVFKPGFTGSKNIYAAVSGNAGIGSGFQQVGTFTPIAATQALSAVSVTPLAGAGQAQSFTFNYFDPNGYPDISGSQVLFNSSASAVAGCYILFGRGTNQIALADDAGSVFPVAALGAQTVLQNSQCTVFPGNSFQSGSATNLSLTIAVVFKPGFAGVKNIYSALQSNGGVRSTFPLLGTWTVPSGPPALAVLSVTPAAATGPSQALTFLFSDPNGFADITGAQIIVNPTPAAGAGSCAVRFIGALGLVALTADDGGSATTSPLGQPAALQNSQCIVNTASSYKSGNGNYLSLTFFITMKTPGTKNIYAAASSNLSATAGYSQVGVWNVTSPATLTPVSVSPATGAGPAGTAQYFTFTYSDPVGASDIAGSQIVLNAALQGAGACYVLYARGTGLIALASNDAGSFSTGALGAPALLQNSQCSIDLSSSFQVQTGTTVNLTLAVNFATTYRQLLYVFSNIQNNAGLVSSFPALSSYAVQ